MTDLPEPGPVQELKDLRADVAGRAPEELHRARGLLLADIQAERGSGDSSHRAFPFRGTSRLLSASRLGGAVRPPARRGPRLAMFGGVATAVVATATAIAMILLPSPPRPLPPSAPPTGGSPGPWVPQTSSPAVLTAAYVLNQAASAAAASSQPVPRPGQFIYVSSVGSGQVTDMSPAGGKSWLYKQNSQSWLSVDGQRTGLVQLVERGYVKLPWGPPVPANRGVGTSWISLPPSSCPGAAPARSTYEFLASLPTDPVRLHTWIYQHLNGQNPADRQAWIDIGDMLRGMLVPSKLAAALFRVAATIPGARVVAHATNVVGRAGVAVSRSGTELIFDPKTYQLIGEGSVLTKAAKGVGPAGTVVGASAILRVAVVDHLPKVPSSQVFPGGGAPKC
jgi:hypothetical protein